MSLSDNDDGLNAGLDDINDVNESKYIKLISKDNKIFIIEKDAACSSGFINTLINGKAKWQEKSGKMIECPLPDISSDILEVVIKYFYFKQKYDNTQEVIYLHHL